MSSFTNPYAPDLTGTLSPKASRQVQDQRASRTLSPFATRDASIIRRDRTHDVATPLRPAFVRDTEKIIHTPAYNRLNGKTQVFSLRADDDIAATSTSSSWAGSRATLVRRSA